MHTTLLILSAILLLGGVGYAIYYYTTYSPRKSVDNMLFGVYRDDGDYCSTKCDSSGCFPSVCSGPLPGCVPCNQT